MRVLVSYVSKRCSGSVYQQAWRYHAASEVSASFFRSRVLNYRSIQLQPYRSMSQRPSSASPTAQKVDDEQLSLTQTHKPSPAHSQHSTIEPNASSLTSSTSNILLYSTSMRVLGIESSCDDTAASVVCGDGVVLSDARHSQQKEMSELYGGVYPKAAALGHAKYIDRVVEKALVDASCTLADIDLVAVTIGPGLAPCLSVGLGKAKELVKLHDIPLMCINHLEAHALTARLIDQTLEFPFMVLLVSGGNCQLVLAEGVDEYRRLGQTLDDAPGEAFDKTARILKIESSDIKGGVAVERASERARARGDAPVKFNEPMIRRRDCNFSFSGLKTNLRRKVKLYAEAQFNGTDACNAGEEHTQTVHSAEHSTGGDYIDHAHTDDTFVSADKKIKQQQYHDALAAGFQDAVFDQIVRRSARALLYADKKLGLQVKSVVISGGVAANSELRRRMTTMLRERDVALACPPIALCTDNAVMIAWAAIERCKAGVPVEGDSEQAQSIRFHPDWPLGSDISKAVAAANMKAW
ncbi:hypothetical protein SARC_11290 [Sphaeroforma arctica JP610]|uniref:N(6)-L-threonylcarbamoyladenine synthase n=1 Tax=Sphaeroforma arctica JP610 TaxID=667725 RepID=A0A0L0FIB2_9EUKA|nr:hypothetical protein SARC_11290 [Sphaeroforma arctica JP610]KNC76201.1 hypothetical protein SARC_11290 [Sphaeroforma arctica JP610]|eukprot:XP_014150103.1 hypothetical protein SARC_11290 [Sphaeroforma arctica JP610]